MVAQKALPRPKKIRKFHGLENGGRLRMPLDKKLAVEANNPKTKVVTPILCQCGLKVETKNKQQQQKTNINMQNIQIKRADTWPISSEDESIPLLYCVYIKKNG